MKKIVVNKTLILFLNINDMISLDKGNLKKIKDEYLKIYDNCIIYNYYNILNHKQLIKDKINKLKFKNQKRINARDCIIKIIESKEKNSFLNVNHIQGTDKSQIYYGAYHNNELVSVMTFDNTKGINGGMKKNEYELSRFSIKIGLIIVGIFNKILKKFITNYKPNRITSFADLNVVNKYNNIYLNNNFKVSKNLSLDFKYFFINGDNLYHKLTYGNKFRKNPKINEDKKNEIIENLHKFWDCGKIKYELLLNKNGTPIYGFIYMIKNKINSKIYIGQTYRNINKRIYEYKAACKYNKFNNKYLGNAFNKYGWDNFEFSIIDTATSINGLNDKEIYYIKKYNSHNKKYGYNLHLGGRNAIPNSETLNKMSKAHLGKKQTQEWVNKRIAKAGTEDAKKYGKKKTKDEREELSKKSPKYWSGKKRSDETKEKISKTKKEKGLSEQQKKAICKKVYKKNITTNKIEVFNSTKHASTNENVNQSTVSRWCKNNKIVNNFQWFYNK